MTLDVVFEENAATFACEFGEVNNVSDGGYERGLAEGYANGEADGRAQGLAEGEQIGFADALSKRTELTVTENGEYTPEGESTGFDKVKVSVTNSKMSQIIDRSVTEITAEDLAGITQIGDYAFYACSILHNVQFSDSITEIGVSAFSNCKGFVGDFTIPDSVTTIRIGAFTNCQNIQSMTIGNGVTEIPMTFLLYGYALTEVTIGTGAKNIINNAFGQCKALKRVTIKGDCIVGSGAFSKCETLEHFSVAPFKLKANYYLNECPMLTVESMLNILNAAQDNTGGKMYTIYFGSTNLAKLTEEQMQIAYDKNINLG